MRAAEALDPDPRDLALLRGYPWLPWLEPMRVRSTLGAEGFACRVCIARYGLRGSDIERLPQSADEVRDHLRAFHHLNP